MLMRRVQHVSRPATLRRAGGRARFATSAAGREKDHAYAKTLLLPSTKFAEFPSASDEQRILKHCNDTIYKWNTEQPKSKPRWTLHDGPPYANGHAHIGHALNKILKDIVNKYKLISGHSVSFVPGWDCHGLPIELKVLEETAKKSGKTKEHVQLSPIDLRKRAREYALGQLDQQRKDFQSWAVMADWENPYITMNAAYEARQVGVFNEMYRQNLIYRALKPVFWSPATKTALAEAELEYNDEHTSQTAYVGLRLLNTSKCAIGKKIEAFGDVRALIWTTTPWTLAANRAVCVNADLDYAIVKGIGENSPKFIIAAGRMQHITGALHGPLDVLATFKGSELAGLEFAQPLDSSAPSPVLMGEHVVLDTGTGLVHTAPGHGLEDYAVCARASIAPYCPVDESGCFTAEAGSDLAGKFVLKAGNATVVEKLRNAGLLVLAEPYKHRYPYDWRAKQPVILRATKQWFTNLRSVRTSALTALEDVQLIPAAGRARLEGMLRYREDWCISRQRSWGVPIPVFYDKATDEPVVTDEISKHIEQVFREHGSDAWWKLKMEDLLPPSMKGKANDLRRGDDTMDVWFDSGVSWDAVLRERGLSYPADMYLEGSDQHRGWFQSSILTSAAVTGKAPYKSVLTHGFLLDEQGRKMSKSLGNVIEPSLIIRGGKDLKKNPKYGVDVLRMWVASVDYTQDVVIGPFVLRQVGETVRRVRNSGKFLLGNTGDFNFATDAVSYAQLQPVDQYQLFMLHSLLLNVKESYEAFAFSKVYSALATFLSDLSAFYFVTVKDRLYCDAKTSIERRSAQTVLHHLLDALIAITAPITTLAAEEMHLNRGQSGNAFSKGWLHPPSEWRNEEIAATFAHVLSLRSAINQAVEALVAAKEVPHTQAVSIRVNMPNNSKLMKTTTALKDYLPDLLRVASCVITTGTKTALGKYDIVTSVANEEVEIYLTKANHEKCPRCWRYAAEAQDTLCGRCDALLK